MRIFEIWSRGKLLGETDLEMHDSEIRMGTFRPRPDYLGVRPVFKMYSDALDLRGDAQRRATLEYYRKRDELELIVRERGGAELPSRAVHIVDTDDGVGEIQIEVYPPDA
jgi:hypothetical protein